MKTTPTTPTMSQSMKVMLSMVAVFLIVGLLTIYGYKIGRSSELECDSNASKAMINKLATDRGMTVEELSAFTVVKETHDESMCTVMYRTSRMNENDILTYRVYKGIDGVLAIQTF